MRMAKWIQCMNGRWKVYPWNIHKMDIRRKKRKDLSSSRNVSTLNSTSIPFRIWCLFPNRGVGPNIVVADFRRGLDRWWTCAALSPLVEPRGKCPRNWASKDICKKISHRSQSHCGATWAPPFLRQNCVRPRPLLNSCTSFLSSWQVNQLIFKNVIKISVKQSKKKNPNPLPVLVIKSGSYQWISLFALSLRKKKKKSIEIEFSRLMVVLLREPWLKKRYSKGLAVLFRSIQGQWRMGTSQLRLNLEGPNASPLARNGKTQHFIKRLQFWMPSHRAHHPKRIVHLYAKCLLSKETKLDSGLAIHLGDNLVIPVLVNSLEML